VIMALLLRNEILQGVIYGMLGALVLISIGIGAFEIGLRYGRRKELRKQNRKH
jgi:hypothetical protein